MKYSIVTFGCRVNQADSLQLEEALLLEGAVPTAPEHAEVVIVNTCSVTASADQGARQTIRRVARANPSASIVVTGCYATRQPDEVAALPGVVQVVANETKGDISKLLPLWSGGAVLRGRGARADEARPADELPSTAERAVDGDGGCGAAIAPGIMGRTAFTLRVQTGCGEPCAYCIIPTTRGTPRSVPIQEIVREVTRICAAGFKEIVLTGVHLGSYGADHTPRSSLLALLEALADLELDDVLFRLSSLEPMDCTPAIVGLVAERPCFAHHFHLPLQHASPAMLTAMRRPYSIAKYAALVDDIRRRMPDAAIGSDLIVGFPGETAGDFEALRTYLVDAPLTHLHVFPYSDRPGTAAAALPDKVHGSAVRVRGREIRDISARLTKRFHEHQVGRRHRALAIDEGDSAVTGNYLKVKLDARQPRNTWVVVEVGGAPSSLTGTVVATEGPVSLRKGDAGEELSGGVAPLVHHELTAGGTDVPTAALPD